MSNLEILRSKANLILALSLITTLLLTSLYIYKISQSASFPPSLAKDNSLTNPALITYDQLLQQISLVSSELATQSYSAKLIRAVDSKIINLDYTPGIFHIFLEANQFSNPNPLHLFIFTSDGSFDVNRSVLCNDTLQDCKDFTLSTLTIPALYYGTELYTTLFGIDIYDLDGLIMDISMLDPGFIKILHKNLTDPSWWFIDGVSSKSKLAYLNKNTFTATRATTLGSETCLGVSLKPLHSLPSSQDIRGWCFIDSKNTTGLQGSGTLTTLLDLYPLHPFKKPEKVTLEPAAFSITPAMARAIQAKGIATSTFILNLKKQPFLNN